MENIKAISFDGDGTLWDFENAMRGALKEVLNLLKRWFPEKTTGLEIETLIEIRNEIAENAKGKFINLVEIREESFREVLRRLGEYSEEKFETMKKVYFDARFRLVKVYPDTVPVIKTLKKKYRVGVLSNGNTYPEKVGLQGLFDFTLYAEDAGVSKPDEEIFLKLLKHLRIKPNELIHVGDSLEHDIFPALKLGIKAILINRSNNRIDSSDRKLITIKSLEELLSFLHF